MSRKVVTRSVTPRAATPARRIWVTPTIYKVRAGDAEIGPNPDNADGAFTFS